MGDAWTDVTAFPEHLCLCRMESDGWLLLMGTVKSLPTHSVSFLMLSTE
jgi:hypothetical protein